ncbi:MAG: YtxH domain-containing protein [Cytophagaceae bacterium]|nr:MAG: YtxH domain-containing protein [Cytophagaceae bacterium]
MKQYRHGALPGLLAGLAIGFLTAPQAGKITRQKLVDSLNGKTSGFASGLKGQWDKTRMMANELIENVRAEAGVFAYKAEKTVDFYRDKTNSAHQKTDKRDNHQVDELADAAKSGVNDAQDAIKTS